MAAKPVGRRRTPVFAAVDLGTNNCRLLVARATAGGKIRVVDSFSRIVRLGEGLGETGRLSEPAMDRTLAALKICADRIARAGATHVRAVTTQAGRQAANADILCARAYAETGLTLQILTTDEEAALAADGCAPLIGRRYNGALVFDIGGGSTEVIWMRRHNGAAKVLYAQSLPVGVVTLAERETAPITRPRYRALCAEMIALFAAMRTRLDGVGAFTPADHHLLGTSGTVTTLGGIALGLSHYVRAKVDGSWHRSENLLRIVEDIAGRDLAARARLGCVGKERADLIVPGCAIFRAIHANWPCAELRVADRGLREGMLRQMMMEAEGRR